MLFTILQKNTPGLNKNNCIFLQSDLNITTLCSGMIVNIKQYLKWTRRAKKKKKTCVITYCYHGVIITPLKNKEKIIRQAILWNYYH